MSRWTAPSDLDYYNEFGPRLVMCERCGQHPLSMPEYDVLCEQCRRADAAKAMREQRQIERTKGAA